MAEREISSQIYKNYLTLIFFLIHIPNTNSNFNKLEPTKSWFTKTGLNNVLQKLTLRFILFCVLQNIMPTRGHNPPGHNTGVPQPPPHPHRHHQLGLRPRRPQYTPRQRHHHRQGN